MAHQFIVEVDSPPRPPHKRYLFMQMPPLKNCSFEVKNGDISSTPRKLTRDELRKAAPLRETISIARKQVEDAQHRLELANKKLKKLSAKCNHLVVFDEDVYPYYFRYCGVCGSHIGTL